MKKYKISQIVALGFLAAFAFNCNKTSNAPDPKTVDPTNANALTEVLVIPNSQLVNSPTLPASSPQTAAPVITNNDVSVSYSAGSQIVLPMDVSTPTAANIAGVYIQVDGASSYQNVPIAASTSSGTISIPITVPYFIAYGIFFYTYKFYDASGNVSAPQTVAVTITASENCNTTKVSGGQGVTSTTFKLNDKPGVVKIQFETYQVPDKIDVFQDGVWIGGTGPVTSRKTLRKALACNIATANLGYIGDNGEFNFPYDPAKGDKVEVVVSGCENGGTAWQYNISCPTEAPKASFTFDGKTYTFPIASYGFTGGIGSAGGLIFSTPLIKYDGEEDKLFGSGDVIGLGFLSANAQGLIMKNGQLTENDLHTFFFDVSCNNSNGIQPAKDCVVSYDESDVNTGTVLIKKTGLNIYDLKLNVTFDDGKKLIGNYKGSFGHW